MIPMGQLRAGADARTSADQFYSLVHGREIKEERTYIVTETTLPVDGGCGVVAVWYDGTR